MKTMKQLYESPCCVKYSANVPIGSICTTSPTEYSSTLENWQEEDLDLD